MMNYFYFDEKIKYPMSAPYGPTKAYPEYPHSDHSGMSQDEDNAVYESMRILLYNCGFDRDHYETASWNPFGEWVKPGDTVLIKPNLVMDQNPAEEDPIRGIHCMITHPAFVRFMYDYTVIALQGKGMIIVGDAPVQDCDFDNMKMISGYGALFDFMKNAAPDGIDVICGDFRDTCLKREDGKLIQSDNAQKVFEGRIVDLRDNSYFEDYRHKNKLRVTNYDGAETVFHHTNGKNEYCVNSCVLKANVIFNLCKPKTHRIAGYTGAMKNLVGMNSRKEYLPHHTKGNNLHGGDEYSGGHFFLKFLNSFANDQKNRAMKLKRIRFARFFDDLGRKTGKCLDKKEPGRAKFGMWYQNDTIWRTILDLNHLVLFCDKMGKTASIPQRRMINIGDMIISGEGEGPLCPSYKHVGGILFSDSPVEFDYILVYLMGFDPDSFPVMIHALTDKFLKVSLPVIVNSNDDRFCGNADDLQMNFAFKPTSGWRPLLAHTFNGEES